MDGATARKLDRSLNPHHKPDLSRAVAMTRSARAALGTPTDAALIDALGKDKVSWDPEIKKLIATRSAIPVDTAVRPNPKSFEFDTVEQCMEFVMRYFKTEMQENGRPDGSFATDFQVQHDIAPEVRQMAAGTLRLPGYAAYRNGGSVPPRAGDVVSLEARDGEFHVALITKVDQDVDGNWFARVYQANVPFDVDDPDVARHFQDLPMTVDAAGNWQIQRVATSTEGYGEDMDVIGWIHPEGAKALPGSPAEQEKAAA